MREHGAAGKDNARLFIVPGMNHSSGGPATDQFDMVDALVAWVEQGVAPGDPVYVRFAPSASMPSLVQPGAFRKDADGGTAKLSRGSRWLKAAAAGGIANRSPDQTASPGPIG